MLPCGTPTLFFLRMPHDHSPLGRTTVFALAALSVFAMTAHAPRQSHARTLHRPREPAELRGSRESVEKMYDFAQSYGLPFYGVPSALDDAVARGRLVLLPGDSAYEVKSDVGFSYSTREAKQFVTAFAPQYLAACGTPLTVTSAARPLSKQPRNANLHSVHPTGIAADLPRPHAGPCLESVRASLAELDRI